MVGWHPDSMDMSLSKLRELGIDKGSLVCGSPWGHKESDTTEHRERFTRALLESKDLSMRFSLPLCVWAPGSAPAPWKQPLRKDLQEPLIPQAGKRSSQEVG